MLKIAHARRFVQHVGPHVVKPARVIWNQIIGLIFLIVALPVLAQAYKFYKNLSTEPQNGVRLVFALSFGILLAAFGMHSLWRARKISRS